MNYKNILFVIFMGMLLCACGEKKSLMSEGKVDQNSQRQGFWNIRNNGIKVAEGNYINGLKNGVWKYKERNYNDKNEVDWRFYKDDWGLINIPKDWKLHTDSISILSASYGGISFNIIVIDPEGKGMNVLVEDIEKVNSRKEKYAVLEKHSVLINGYSGFVIRQKMLLSNGSNYCEQYILLKEKEQALFLLSFYDSKGLRKESNKVFSEIAFSIQLY